MITEEQYREIADSLEIEVAVIKAVDEVESKGSGFLETGEPKILFEPHIFWKELKKVGKDPKSYQALYKNVLYEKWGEQPYGKYSEQHARLQKASKIHREAALKSASWGRFQILAQNYKECGKDSVQEFINDIYKDEYHHLKLFAEFVRNTGLLKYLKTKNWEDFSRGYNGPLYKNNKYDIKLRKAYNKWQQEQH